MQRFLARNLPGLVSATDDEVRHAAELALADVRDDGWTSVNLWHLAGAGAARHQPHHRGKRCLP